MTPSEFKAAGLEKLSPAELAKLNGWLQGYREKAVKKAVAREAKTKMQLVVSRIDGVYNGVGTGQHHSPGRRHGLEGRERRRTLRRLCGPPGRGYFQKHFRLENADQQHRGILRAAGGATLERWLA